MTTATPTFKGNTFAHSPQLDPAALHSMTTTQPQAAYTTSQLQTVWNHLDLLCPDDGDLLTVAAESIEAVAMALRDSKPVHPDVMARLLDSAARAVREAHRHTGTAIIEPGELTY